jgi:hypothetical protein|tara:strand:- start:2032 stop:2217 length:186 start_codon:yes stop_codon:yes gene_type:complete
MCDEWLYVNRLCDDCKKTRGLLRIVGKERFMNAIERCFIIQEQKGVLTRSKKKILEEQIMD